jgi:hypothetical protein
VFSAIFRHDIGYLAMCTLLGLLCGGASWMLAHKLKKPHGPWWAALTFTLVGVLGVTFMGGGPASETCVLNRLFAEPFRTTQGLWNLAMLVPVGVCALMAVRRPLPVLLGVIALPLAIEFTQATVDGLGRICDSSDAEMNIIGGLIGVTLAGTFLAARRSLAWKAGARGTMIGLAVFLLAGSGLAAPMLTFTIVDGTGLSAADAEQRRAVGLAVKEAFGDRYTIGQVQEEPCAGAPCTHIIFNLHSREAGHPQAFAMGRLSWPDKRHLNVQLEDGDRPTVMGFPVKGAKVPSTGVAASRIATSYALQKYAWVRSATTKDTSAVGGKDERGWTTRWRWTHRGVLMPRMLEVQVDRTGRVSQIDVTRGPIRIDLPEAELDAAQAEKAVRKAVEIQLRSRHNTGAEFRTRAVTVKAAEQNGRWRPNWLVNVTWPPVTGQGDAAQEDVPPDVYRVDAVTGAVYELYGQPLRTS